MSVNKELVGASTRLFVLALLSHEATYGYEVVKRLNDRSGGLFTWQEGSVYPVLHKLEKEGLVRSRWQQAETGRERKYYHVTVKGRSVLTGDAEGFTAFHEIMLRMLGGRHA